MVLRNHNKGTNVTVFRGPALIVNVGSAVFANMANGVFGGIVVMLQQSVESLNRAKGRKKQQQRPCAETPI